jgi:hypothetical protein
MIEQLNSTILAVNDKLNALNLKEEVWLYDPILTYDDVDFAIEGHLFVRKFCGVCLGYASVDGVWQLALREVTRRCARDLDEVVMYGLNEEVDLVVWEDEPPKPLLQADPWERAKGVSNITRLLEQIRRRAEVELEEVETAEDVGAKL